MDENKNDLFKKFLKKEFQKGESSARDPVNAGLPALAIRVTTIGSKWYANYCRECDYQFREGDRVRLCPKCNLAFHEDNTQHEECWSKKFFQAGENCGCGDNYVWDGYLPDDAPSQKEDAPSAAFVPQVYDMVLDGLGNTWKIPGDLEVHFASKEDPAVGHKCPYCAFLIRVGDRYIRCENCKKAYFHNDIFRHLTCWNEWKSQKGKNYCPISNERCDYDRK